MAAGTLTIDLDAVAANWRGLDAVSAAGVETGAVVKADAYGLGAERVAPALARAGARRFFVARAEEGVALRRVLGRDAEILVFDGHLDGDSDRIGAHRLIPLLNSVEQITRHFEVLPGAPFGLAIDTGMNRLGLTPAEWEASAELVLPMGPNLVMSHLACAEAPKHPKNAEQLRRFRELTEGIDAPRSLAATGGILLDPAYHFDLTRPGIGLYGGLPFSGAEPVVHLRVPVIQIREIAVGESVGYAATWTADAPRRIATIAAGYGDGLMRYLSNRGRVFDGATPCPIVGRVSMDSAGVDVTHLDAEPEALDILGPAQPIDDLAAAAGTIGYEVLTGLGHRYRRDYRASGPR